VIRVRRSDELKPLRKDARIEERANKGLVPVTPVQECKKKRDIMQRGRVEKRLEANLEISATKGKGLQKRRKDRAYVKKKTFGRSY